MYCKVRIYLGLAGLRLTNSVDPDQFDQSFLETSSRLSDNFRSQGPA